MQKIDDFLNLIDKYLGSSPWFVYLLLGTGIFFTLYLGFPQIRYFRHALKVVSGKFDKKGDKGDTSHFQALTTALSGTVGTGNIAGVALAIFLGGPAALFWMLVTALLGMTTKFVEVLLSHKYRETDENGLIAGGPMYYMKSRLNIKKSNGKTIKTGYFLGTIFAISTILSSFGTGSLPQINSISNSLFSTFGINHVLTGAVLAVLLGLVIIGGIKRIARVTSKLVPAMALIYFIGALAVLITNHQNIIPSIVSVFTDVFTGSAAVGGFLGAGIRYAINRGVNRGLFSNEAGQGSAPIAHAAARAHEPVSEGMVAILEPFIDTVIICMLTGLTILSSGVWKEKHPNQFQNADTEVLAGIYSDQDPQHQKALYQFLKDESESPLKTFTGMLTVINGKVQDSVTILNARSVAEEVTVTSSGNKLFTGSIPCKEGVLQLDNNELVLSGKSLVHSAPLTALAFTRSLFGDFGQYLVSIGLLLFAFSTAISWSYYGDRAVTYLWGSRYIQIYRLVYVIGFFLASFVDTTIVWTFSAITIALMTIPNLVGLLLLHREVKTTIKDYWEDFRQNFPSGK
ncbi:MAG: sodium:alanine symporter family protein [Bacteroidales bacterium]|nr:sodium:alanine symporter family protein [Bacteroidales bacterium]